MKRLLLLTFLMVPAAFAVKEKTGEEVARQAELDRQLLAVASGDRGLRYTIKELLEMGACWNHECTGTTLCIAQY